MCLNLHLLHGLFPVAKVPKYNENHKALHRLELQLRLECVDFKNQQPYTHYRSVENVDEVWCHRLVSLNTTCDYHYFPISNNLES